MKTETVTGKPSRRDIARAVERGAKMLAERGIDVCYVSDFNAHGLYNIRYTETLNNRMTLNGG